MKNNKNTFIQFIFPSIFIIVGLFIVALAIFLNIQNSKFMENAIETTAEITKITTSHDSDGDVSHSVQVIFYVDGKEYGGKLGYYSSDMYEGKTVKIYYEAQNPNNFKSDSSNIASFIMIPFGGIFFAVGCFILYRGIKSSSLKKLKEYGRRVDAKIDDVSLNTSYSVNSRHPYIIDCSYFNEIEDKVYSFTSQNIWTNIQPIIDAKNITTIPVYIDENDSSKYFVDISIFDNYIGN